jgi:uncharacterized membrane protein
MGTPSSFILHEHLLVGVEEFLDLMGHFSILCLVGVVCLYVGLQEIKTALVFNCLLSF